MSRMVSFILSEENEVRERMWREGGGGGGGKKVG